MRPADLTEPGYVVGSNPFYHPSFKDAFATADARDFFFQCVTFGRLKSAFSDVIAEYYRFIAADTGKRSAIFFVEKVNHLMMHRRVALDLFPEATQILLVRDMRDVLCSHRNHFQFRDKSIEFMAGQAEQLIEIARNGRTNTIVVRYKTWF